MSKQEAESKDSLQSKLQWDISQWALHTIPLICQTPQLSHRVLYNSSFLNLFGLIGIFAQHFKIVTNGLLLMQERISRQNSVAVIMVHTSNVKTEAGYKARPCVKKKTYIRYDFCCYTIIKPNHCKSGIFVCVDA